MTKSGSGLVRAKRRWRTTTRAQMPFSVIAVLLLVLSSTSIALVYGLDVGRESAPIPEKVLEQMKRNMDGAVQGVARLAYAAAVEATKLVKGLNETAVHERFVECLNASLLAAYPLLDGKIVTGVGHALRLTFLRASLEEAYALYGQDLATWEGASVPAYFAITGNYSIDVSCPRGHISRTVEMEQNVYVPLPLLVYKLDRLSRSAVPRGELETVVRYELSALAQERVLRGYGEGARTGASGTEAVITEEDVVRAIDLALVLEELRFFGGAGGAAAPLTGELGLLEGVEGSVDPADLFLRSYGERSIDLAPLVAQTINARADAITLKLMEYLGLISLVDLGEDVYEWEMQGLTATLDFLTGGDTDQGAMRDYVVKALADAGIPEYEYRWFCYGGGDAYVDLPARKISFMDDTGNLVYRTFQGRYVLDFPRVDLFSSPAWGELNRRYRTETHAVAEAMRAYLGAIASGVASSCSLPLIDLELDPLDDRNYLQEIDAQLREALTDGSPWLRPAIDRASDYSKVRDGLAQAVMDFVDQRWADLLQANASVLKAATDLSWTLAYQLNGTANFSPAATAQAQRTILGELLGDYWGSRETLYRALRDRAAPVLEGLERGLSQKTAEENPLTNLIVLGVSNMPGMERLVATAALDTIGSVREGLTSQGGALLVPVSNGAIALTMADGQRRTELLEAASPPLTLADDGEAGSVCVSLRQPWEHDRANTSYPNRHVTDPLDMTATPYFTQWGVEYHGSVSVVASAKAGGSDVQFSSLIPLDGCFNVLAFSGWGLQGVEYAPTTTLQREVQDLMTKVWDFLTSSVLAVGGLVGKAFNLFCQLASDLLSFATKPLEILNQLLTTALDAIKRVSEDVLAGVVEALSDAACAVLGGTTVHLSVLGISLAVVIAPSDSAVAGAEDRLRTDLTMSAFGATATSSVRVLRLASGQHTIAGTVSIGGDDWSADLTLDPLTKVYEHQVEVRGYLGGHVLEIVAPEVERVQKASFTLSDLPVLSLALKSIPSPVPGTKFQLDAGMELSFNVLDRRTVLINEVELNPQGRDASREWVELFNPTDRPVDLSGWSLVTARGQQRCEELSGVLPAHGYAVHRFAGQALDNGEVKGFPLQESVALVDAEGRRVDSAPWLKDLGDDARTWQRSFDGSSRWELRAGSEGGTNGLVLLSETDLGGLVSIIEECFSEAFDRFVADGMSIDTLDDLIRDALLRLQDRLLDMVEKTVSSLKFFVKLGLADASGSLGGGLTLALVYDGRAVRDCFKWLMDAVGEVLRDPLNPLAAGQRAEVPVRALADHVYVQAAAYVSVSAPDVLPVKAGPRVSATALIKVSLRTLGLFDGSGDWDLGFGLVVSGAQGVKLREGAGVSGGGCYDLWAMRGSLRPA